MRVYSGKGNLCASAETIGREKNSPDTNGVQERDVTTQLANCRFYPIGARTRGNAESINMADITDSTSASH